MVLLVLVLGEEGDSTGQTLQEVRGRGLRLTLYRAVVISPVCFSIGELRRRHAGLSAAQVFWSGFEKNIETQTMY